jgi:hypothetical protein
MSDETTEQVLDEPKEKWNPNPEGKGGFQDHPELINPGGRPKNQESFTYWLNYFKNLSVIEFENWQVNNPKDKRTVAANLAFQRVYNALGDLPEFKEVADRTEGRAKQPIEHSGELDFSVRKLEGVIDDILEDENSELNKDKEAS